MDRKGTHTDECSHHTNDSDVSSDEHCKDDKTELLDLLQRCIVDAFTECDEEIMNTLAALLCDCTEGILAPHNAQAYRKDADVWRQFTTNNPNERDECLWLMGDGPIVDPTTLCVSDIVWRAWIQFQQNLIES